MVSLVCLVLIFPLVSAKGTTRKKKLGSLDL